MMAPSPISSYAPWEQEDPPSDLGKAIEAPATSANTGAGETHGNELGVMHIAGLDTLLGISDQVSLIIDGNQPNAPG